MTRLVFFTAAAIASQSNGMIVRRSTTITLMPSFSACCAASSERCTSAPQVSTTTSVPSRRTRGLAERDHVVAAGILALVVGLAVEVLVLEEQDRVVAADRGAQQARRVLRVRRERDADAGAVREDALARLRVVRRAAAQVAADRRRGSPSGTRRRCSSGSAASTSRRASASSPARCSRRTGSRRPA